MILAGDFRNGTTFEMDGGVFRVVEFQHVKPGKGAAFVRTKLKNVETGQVVEKTFRAGEKVAKAMLDRREMQYLYKEGNDLVMMDLETYEQLPVPAETVGDGIKYLKEKAPKIDLALFPVDRRMGKDYMKGAKQFIEQIKTTIFVPMHFSEDYEGGNALRDFAENAGCRFVSITHRGESFEITK